MKTILKKCTILTIGDNEKEHHSLRNDFFDISFMHSETVLKAKKLLISYKKISVIILNISLTDKSNGLNFIRYVREKLHNHEVRIILKSAEKHSFVDQKIIRNYEIDGFFPKNTTSNGRIAVAIIAAIRSYEQIIITKKLLKSLAGSIAHEVRNPLNAISMITNQMEQHIIDLPKEISVKKELLDLTSLAYTSVNRANQIIDMTLEDIRYDMIDKNNFINIPASVAITNALKEYGYKNKLERSRTIFKQNVKNDFIFKGDESTFIYIIFNIIKNSLYYLAEFPHLSITISSKKASGSEKFNKIIIEDTGPGIPHAKLKTIFDSFETSGKEGGTGLGLPFCRRTMRSFGGEVTCHSILGESTKFTLSFPIIQDSETKNSTIDNSTPNKILIVDDQEINLLITKNIIEKNLSNTVCSIALNGVEAIEKFQKEKPDLIFMDIQMPIMDGYKATKEIKKIDSEIPIVAYSSLESLKSKKQASEAGIDHYITKPISHNILIRTIRKWMMSDHQPITDEETIKEILKNKRALLADDQEINNLILSRLLENQFNMRVDKVTDGKALLEKFQSASMQNDPYDIILTDIHMDPGMSGIEASKQVRIYEITNKLKYKTPIIAITGDDDKSFIHELFRSGIDDYSKKGNASHGMLYSLAAFWIAERTGRRMRKEILSTKTAYNPTVKNPEECQYYDNDYDNMVLFNDKISEADLITMTSLFLECSSELIKKIRTSYESNNIPEFKLHVHSLKGIAGNMGAERLFRFSHNLHEASKEVDVIKNSCMEKLEEIYLETKKALNNLKK